MKFFSWICFLWAIIMFSSCATQKRVPVNYLERVSDTSVVVIEAANATIRTNDLLSIRVYSMSINPATDIPYNLPETAGAAGGPGSGGFLVDRNGFIEYPRIGTVKAAGLTREELAELIRMKLQDQLLQPSVVVRFLNYRFTVLGEVRTPGTFTVPSENVTILEALGLAGDVTEFGKRNQVKVMRERENGQREIATVDLTSTAMFSSPYFRLQQNDVVFVDQAERRLRQQEQQQVVQQIQIATGLITTIALILNFIK
jgi:polysaccharide biosynthesis/export protein